MSAFFVIVTDSQTSQVDAHSDGRGDKCVSTTKTMNATMLFLSLTAASFLIGLRKSKNDDGVRLDWVLELIARAYVRNVQRIVEVVLWIEKYFVCGRVVCSWLAHIALWLATGQIFVFGTRLHA